MATAVTHRRSPTPRASALLWNPFDITKAWPIGQFPLFEIGKLALNRNPFDVVAETEHAASIQAHRSSTLLTVLDHPTGSTMSGLECAAAFMCRRFTSDAIERLSAS